MITSALTPTRLRLVLSISLLLIVIAGASLFYLAYNRLSAVAAETGASAAHARESQDTLQQLQLLRTELDSQREAIEIASKVTANSQNYAYQETLVRDLTVYAERAGLQIRNIIFSAPTSPSATAVEPTDTGATPAPSAGLNKATVNITLATPVNYASLLNFLHYIEQNLTKLKVSQVSLTKSDSDNVIIDSLNLEVYIQ